MVAQLFGGGFILAHWAGLQPGAHGGVQPTIPAMTFSSISALSPLDGRYAAKLAALRPLMSEQGYMHRRVQVEVAWFIALSDAGFPNSSHLSTGARTYLLGLVKTFQRSRWRWPSRQIEKTTNHDVKAVEYWIKSKFEPARVAGKATGIRALRLHQRRHQQHQPCPATAGGPRRGAAARRWTACCQAARAWRACLCRCAHAQPHPRPDRQPHHRGQGDRQCGGAPAGGRDRIAAVGSWPR
jgi:hypothetical protein